ncbi:hypothetical protein ACKWTF_014599 [Chironomus riparius]
MLTMDFKKLPKVNKTISKFNERKNKILNHFDLLSTLELLWYFHAACQIIAVLIFIFFNWTMKNLAEFKCFQTKMLDDSCIGALGEGKLNYVMRNFIFVSFILVIIGFTIGIKYKRQEYMTPYLFVKFVVLEFLCFMFFTFEDQFLTNWTLFAVCIETFLLVLEFKIYQLFYFGTDSVPDIKV